MSSDVSPSPLDALVEQAAATDPVAEGITKLAARLPRDQALLALERAFAVHEVDAATVLALVLLAHGEPAEAHAIERIFPDSIDDRAAQILVASHPDRLAILERILASRKPDRFQLASAAALYTHLHPSPPWPAPLIETLRTLARARPGWVGEQYALEAAWRVSDPNVDELYKIDRAKKAPESSFAELGETPGIDALTPSRAHVIATGFTARRASEKVGRNDACPCGSGKKYKKCCADKERGETWSPVAGLTMREYRRRLHEFATVEEMLRQHPADLVRLPFEALSTEQLDACFQVFVDCERMDDAERALELLAERDLGEGFTIDDLRAELVTFAHDWGHDELAARHLSRFRDPEKVPPQVRLGRELRVPTPGALALLESECRAHFLEGKPPPMSLAYELLEPYPALGIVVARGSLDPEHTEDSTTLLNEIEWARDRLGAPPDDPYWGVWDLMVQEKRLAKVDDAEKAALREELERVRAEAADARAEAHVHVRELGKYRDQLTDLEDKAKASERKISKTARERAAQEADAEAARKLRGKIRELEVRIREGQVERAELRKQAEEIAKSAPRKQESKKSEEDDDDEEDGESLAPRALRVPVWSTKAIASLEKMPRNIASQAIATAGALGAGRTEGWRHAKVLEGMHGLCSARLGIHHRLLFRVDEEGILDVDEVVTREDLDRALAARR